MDAKGSPFDLGHADHRLQLHFKRSAALIGLAHLLLYGALNLVATVAVSRFGDAPTWLVLAYGVLGTPLMHVLEFGLPGLSAVDAIVLMTAVLNSSLWGLCVAALWRRLARRRAAKRVTAI
jgi:hypothetical protein